MGLSGIMTPKGGDETVYHITVCDDSADDRHYIRTFVLAWAEETHTEVSISEVSGGEQFLFRHADGAECDILLLDIEMGQMDGVTLAKRIRQHDDSVQIVFITGFADYIAQGYEVSALHYLIKPVSAEKLFAVLDRAVTALRKTERMIMLPAGGEMLRLPVSRLQFVEAFSHTVAIVTDQDTIQAKMSISEAEKLLGDGFVRCHRSYLVSLKHIARLSKTEVVLDCGKTLPLSRGAAAQVHRAFISYYTGESHETL